MNLDRKVRCAYCRKIIPPPEEFYGVSFGTSSSAALPMTSIIAVHWNCTYKILDRWARDRVIKDRSKKGRPA